VTPKQQRPTMLMRSSPYDFQRAFRRLAPFGLLFVCLPFMAAAKPMAPSMTGQVGIFWTQTQGGTLSVRVMVTGLAPYSRHPAHLHQGSCQALGMMEYPLHDVIANRDGVGWSITTLTGFPHGIPSAALAVHQGPNMLTTAAATPIACATTFALGHATDVAAHEWLTVHPLSGMDAMTMP
jgi:hypothetical protein